MAAAVAVRRMQSGGLQLAVRTDSRGLLTPADSSSSRARSRQWVQQVVATGGPQRMGLMMRGMRL
jgi:hypothetical protein